MITKLYFKIIYKKLKQKYGNLNSSLNFSNEVECWAAVLLSVQNTDKHINTITPKLFAKFKTFEDYANSSVDEIFEYIKGVNYNRTKAKYLYNGARMICLVPSVPFEKGDTAKPRGFEKGDTGNLVGFETTRRLPNNLAELMKLPGVGRKVGNVILSEMNNVSEGIAIDTHNLRVWNRLLCIPSLGKVDLNEATKWQVKRRKGFKDKQLNTIQLEQLLMQNLDKSTWREISLLVIEHGRNICKARNPKCEECVLKKYCEYYKQNPA